MDTAQIIGLLTAERDRLSRAIEALQGGGRRRGRPPRSGANAVSSVPAAVTMKSPARKRKLSAAGRKAIADAAKRRWAAIKAAKATSPSAKGEAKKK